jgi:putative CocE/NonD family hydrolase
LKTKGLKKLFVSICLVLFLAILPLMAFCNEVSLENQAQQPEEYDVKANYTKAEYMVPMRDGVKLYTAVYTPKDASPTNKYPIFLYRTPYSAKNYGIDEYRPHLGPSDFLMEEKYIFVYQDARGRFESEGEWSFLTPYNPNRGKNADLSHPELVDESSDNWDTIEWLINNISYNTGKVGQYGVSYNAWQTVMGMIDAHPALKASAPQMTPGDLFLGDDFYHYGAFRLLYTFGWLSQNAQPEGGEPFTWPTPDGYRFLLELGPVSNITQKVGLDQVPTWNDVTGAWTWTEYWQSRNMMKDMNNITHPILNVVALFDAEDYYGAIGVYHAIEEKNPVNKSALVLGPWRHGGQRSDGDELGNIRFESKTGVYYRENIELPFFNYYLKGKGSFPAAAEAIVFETGSNVWKEYDQWPPEGSKKKRLYLHADGKLSFTAPTEQGGVFDSYVSDPDKPVPFTAETTRSQGHLWMIEDQRFASTRPDVLVYETDVLEEDVTIVGPIIVNLNGSTSGTDCDWVVKLIDVYPGDAPDNEPNPCNIRMGHFQMLLGGNVFRSKFRNSFEEPEPLVPDQITKIEFDLLDKNHTFLKGHSIMVQIQSTWFPVIDRNPGKFCNIMEAVEADFQKTTQKVYRSAEFPTYIEVNVLE